MRIITVLVLLVIAVRLGACKTNQPDPVSLQDTTIHQHPSDSISIGSFAPTSGLTGTVVRITGEGFGIDKSKVAVAFGNVPAAIDSLSQKQIVVRVPETATTALINISVAGKTVQSVQPFVVTGPVIESFSPAAGVVGTVVRITGQGFGTDKSRVTVMFGDMPAPIDSLSLTQIVVKVPAQALTSVIKISVGGKVLSSTQQFTVLFSPAAFSYASVDFASISVSGTETTWTRDADGSNLKRSTSPYGTTLTYSDSVLSCTSDCDNTDLNDMMKICCNSRVSHLIGTNNLGTTVMSKHIWIDVDTLRRVFRSVSFESSIGVYSSNNETGNRITSDDKDISFTLTEVPYQELSDGSLLCLLQANDLALHLSKLHWSREGDNYQTHFGIAVGTSGVTTVADKFAVTSSDAFIRITIKR